MEATAKKPKAKKEQFRLVLEDRSAGGYASPAQRLRWILSYAKAKGFKCVTCLPERETESE